MIINLVLWRVKALLIVLTSIIDKIVKHEKRKLYCSFVDLEQFDMFYNDNRLTVVQKFTYLNVTLSSNGIVYQVQKASVTVFTQLYFWYCCFINNRQDSFHTIRREEVTNFFWRHYDSLNLDTGVLMIKNKAIKCYNYIQSFHICVSIAVIISFME